MLFDIYIYTPTFPCWVLIRFVTRSLIVVDSSPVVMPSRYDFTVPVERLVVDSRLPLVDLVIRTAATGFVDSRWCLRAPVVETFPVCAHASRLFAFAALPLGWIPLPRLPFCGCGALLCLAHNAH